ncbi:MAG: hypothetical protein R3B38_02760 [Patescibacteria group bacterium]
MEREFQDNNPEYRAPQPTESGFISPEQPHQNDVEDIFDDEPEIEIARKLVEVNQAPDPIERIIDHQVSHPNEELDSESRVSKYQRQNKIIDSVAFEQNKRFSEMAVDAARAQKVDAKNARFMNGLTALINKATGSGNK